MTKPKIEETIQPAKEAVVEQTSLLKTFTQNHPRAAKVVGITALTAATFAAISAWQAYKLNEANEAEVLEGKVVVIDDTSSETA